MSFYDDVLREFTTNKAEAKGASNFVRGLTSAKVIRAQNVMDYYATGIKTTDNFNQQLACIMPPFKSVWIEADHAARYVVDDLDIPWPRNLFERAGVYIETFDGRQGEKERWYIRYIMFFHFSSDFMEISGDGFPYVHSFGSLSLKDDGYLLTNRFENRNDQSQEIQLLVSLSHQVFFDAMLLALSFMNCKNVALDAVTPPAPARSAEDKRLNRWPTFEHAYHTIDVQPLKEFLRRQREGVGSSGKAMQAHIVRGHFSTYTEAKPLFGRAGLSGTFWIPQHAKGNAGTFDDVDYNIDLEGNV